METRGAESYQPRTRWCGPHPYAAVSAPPLEPDGSPASPPPPRAALVRVTPRARASSCADVLLAQLRRDLQRGHWRVALRHFLMLEACGYEVPPAERRSCLEHARACAGRQWLKIQADVAEWARCLTPQRPTGRTPACGRAAGS